MEQIPDCDKKHILITKCETLLKIILEYHDLQLYTDEKYKNLRLNENRLFGSNIYQRYKDGEYVDGVKMKYGEDTIPKSFQEYLEMVFPRYYEVWNIYEMSKSSTFNKESLIRLNNIHKMYTSM